MICNYDENALLESSGIALLFNLILSVYTSDFKLPSSLNLCFIIDLVLSYLLIIPVEKMLPSLYVGGHKKPN